MSLSIPGVRSLGDGELPRGRVFTLETAFLTLLGSMIVLYEGRVYVFQYTVISPLHMVEKNDFDLMMMGTVKVTYIGIVLVGQEVKFLMNQNAAEEYDDLTTRYIPIRRTSSVGFGSRTTKTNA